MRELHTQRHNDFHAFGREKLGRYILAALFCGIVAGIVGPFGSYQTMDSGLRFLYWISIISLGWAQMLVISYGMRSVLANVRLPGWAIMLLIAIVGSIPILFEVRWISAMIGVEPSNQLSTIILAYVNVYFITALFSILQWSVIENWPLDIINQNKSVPQISPSSTQPNKRLRLARMPNGLEGEILCLEMEDHYLRVHTNHGNDLVLHRLADAVQELNGHDGMQVHRSWWVARQAIESVELKNRQQFLILCNGLRIPISRGFLSEVKKAGWIC